MSERLTHEQFDQKVEGLATTYQVLAGIDFTPSGLTGGEVGNDVLYSTRTQDPYGLEFTRGIRHGLQRLRSDVGSWARRTHDRDALIDELGSDERLRVAGVLAMSTAPPSKEQFNTVALKIYELLDAIAQQKPVVVSRPGQKRVVDNRWQDDVQTVGAHNGRIKVMHSGHVTDHLVQIWSDRPDNIYADTPDDKGRHAQTAFPILTLRLDELHNGQTVIHYPPETEAAA